MSRIRVPVAAFTVLAWTGGIAACGHGAAQDSSSALTARLDEMSRESTDLKKQLESMSARITDLENLVLKQMNEVKKIKVALATAPKTIGPVAAQAPEPAIVPEWKPEPAAPEPEDEEPRPLLKLYGSSEPFGDPGNVAASVEAADFLSDGSDLGTLVAFKLPALEEVPAIEKPDQPLASQPDQSGPVDPYEQGVLKYENEEWASAILYFDIYLKHDPKGSKVMNALFLKAESLYQTKNYIEAIGQFELILERYPKSPRSADAMLRIGRCYEKLGDKTKALSFYQQIVAKYPGTGQAGKAEKLLQAMK